MAHPAKKKVRKAPSHPSASKRRLFAAAAAPSPTVGTPALRVVTQTTPSIESRLAALESDNADLRRMVERMTTMFDQLVQAGARATAAGQESVDASRPAAEPSVDPSAEDLGGESA